MMFAQADFLDPFHNHHVVADGGFTFSLEHFRELIGFHAGAFRHFDQSFGGAQRRFFHSLGLKVGTKLFLNFRIMRGDFIGVGLCHIKIRIK
jgi:hypothetical protein